MAWRTFQEDLVKKVKNLLPHIHYLSDGCGGQYKNKFNFANLCQHYKDFNLTCEWHFFATCHGKNACDGIGGILKRGAYKASLQRADKQVNCITTPERFRDYCAEHSKSIECVLITVSDINNTEIKLKDRFDAAVTVKGTLGYHHMVPYDESHIKAYRSNLKFRNWKSV